MKDSGQEQQQWADLPKELLETIGKCFDSRVDILRFRSVCSSWRCSVSCSFDQEIPKLYLKLPQPIGLNAILYQSSLCKIEFITHQKAKPSFCSSSNSNSKSKGWLVKVGESKYGKLELLHPLSDYKIRYSPFVLNLLDTNFVKLSKGFMLRTQSGYPIYGVNKVVLFSKNEFAIIAICQEGKLGYWKYGDKEWTLLDNTNFQYDDIIEYKGQFYVVDRWGTVSWIDKSLRVIQYAPPLFGCGGKKNLVESCGDLYVVDRYLDGERRTWNDHDHDHESAAARRRRIRKCSPKAIDFRVHKLDEEWGTWIDVNSLGDRVFVFGIDCSFSISCDELVGGKGNCIYFTDDDAYIGRGLSNDSIRLFRLEDRVIENVSALPEFFEIFWPPNISST